MSQKNLRPKKPPTDPNMPKRTREEEANPPAAPAAPPMSAVAQRRLRAQQAQAAAPAAESPSTPKPKKSKFQSARSAGQQLKDEAEMEKENAELRRMREEVENKISQRTTEIQQNIFDKKLRAVKTPTKGTESASPTPEVVAVAKIPAATPERESAVARVRREREERSRSALADEDVEMQSVAGSEDENDLEPEVEGSPGRIVEISNFTPTKENCKTTEKYMRFKLHSTQTLVLVGIYELTVKRGAIRVCGSIITAKSAPQVIFSSTANALPVIEALHNRTLHEDGFDVSLTVTSYNSDMANIGKICPIFNNLWTSSSGEPTSFTFRPIYTSNSNIPILSVPPAWGSALSALEDKISQSAIPPRIVITGAKGTGKSTFSRLLANTLLNQSTPTVAYLDVDPGQPEFSQPGTVALHLLDNPTLSPTLATLAPSRAHFIGYTSPKEDPGHYVTCITDLISHYRSNHPNIPLIINTCGWTKGLGLELLQDIVYNAQATDIVHFSSTRFKDTSSPLEALANEHTQTYDLPAAHVPASRFSAADLRSLRIMSYFHRKGQDWDFSSPLTSFPPWVIPTHGQDAGIDAFSILGEYIPVESLPDALEATIVGLVTTPGDLPEPETGVIPLLHSDALPRPEDSEYVGLAVVRKLDVEKGEVQLLTPIAEEEVERWEREGLRVCAVRGRVELPVWEMVCEGWRGEIPFVDGVGGKGEGKGGGVWRVRRNVMRRAQQVR